MTTLRAYQSNNSTTSSTATILLPSDHSSLRVSGGHRHLTLCARAFGYQPTFILSGWQASESSKSDQPQQDQPKNNGIAFSTPSWKLMEEVLHCSSQ